MKKTLYITILGMMFAFIVKAQTTGVKFAPDRTHWSSSAAFRVSTSAILYHSNNIYIRGDTIINNKYCQKIFTSTSYSVNALSSQYFDTTCLQFHNYIYYDNKKLYTDSAFIGNGTLLYDFNLNPGDTFNLLVTNQTGGCNGHYAYYKMPIDSVDSLYYGNKWRKRIVFKQVSGFAFGVNPITWVEGIGDIDHGLGVRDPYNISNWTGVGLFSIYGFIDYCFCDYGYVKLNCFQELGYSTYGNYCTIGACINNMKENFVNNNVSIYPNPASTIINFELGAKNSEIIIFDVLGNTVKQQNALTEKTIIDINDLQNGIYFIQIKTSEGVLTKKIVVQH